MGRTIGSQPQNCEVSPFLYLGKPGIVSPSLNLSLKVHLKPESHFLRLTTLEEYIYLTTVPRIKRTGYKNYLITPSSEES